jgi:hypothetical protein
LTLIDSLSTLAILASAPDDDAGTGPKALKDFQDGVAALVLQYGDGSMGPSGEGLRARGFDVDSKVQVFETVIRGVGGLLSAHLFAAGELPINGYDARPELYKRGKLSKGEIPTIKWPSGFRYDGQLLRLALDLAQRLLPAFYTPTGLPYPRVNLRHGIPFYLKSPLHKAEYSLPEQTEEEITETCSAGAGSLVLEFTVLSRLTDDTRFEQLAKRAFWAVWSRRSAINLIGAGVDAESGHWIGPYAGIGAGTDSFFEYALKTHILLSGHTLPNMTIPLEPREQGWHDPNTMHVPLSEFEHSPEAFLGAWHEAHAAIKRHLYSNNHHPHYVNVHLSTGSPQTYWIDSLGAYYPGLLTLAGEVEEAIETNLLYTALWTRYAALPERWSVRDRHVDGGLGWWPGRPEFIESTYHIYRATHDPWYLHVGEMVLKDIKRRCWTKCGWTGLQDVRTGERSDRMESFFLGETAKYLYLLFDDEHPLNRLDAAYVFTTEGHPLIIPKANPAQRRPKRKSATKDVLSQQITRPRNTCPPAKSAVPFSVSNTASRKDIFHAASLIGLHTIENIHASTTRQPKNTKVPELNETVLYPNHTYYPWTLPTALIPAYGTCDRLPSQQTLTLDFPISNPMPSNGGQSNFMISSTQNLLRYNDGVFVKSLSGLKMAMVHDTNSPIYTRYGTLAEAWRVWSLANVPLGRDELVYISRQSIGDMTDPSFTRIRDPNVLEIVLQLDNIPDANQSTTSSSEELFEENEDVEAPIPTEEEVEIKALSIDESLIGAGLGSEYKTMFSSLLQQVTSALRDPAATLLPSDTKPKPAPETFESIALIAIAPTGVGAFPLPDVAEAPDPNEGRLSQPLLWTKIYIGDQGCTSKLPNTAARDHEIIILRRGGCTFSDKLSNIPSFTPSSTSLKLVIIVSDPTEEDEREKGPSGEDGSDNGEHLFQPLLDKVQTTPSGLTRHNQISMVMIAGGEKVWEMLSRTRSIGLRRRYHVESQGVIVGNIIVV